MFIKYFLSILITISFIVASNDPIKSFYNYNAISIDGDTISMEKYKNKKILLVNLASKCSYTSQYNELQELHESFSDTISILGFPSNDFLWQEPGSNSEIKLFCQRNFGVTFQLFQKIHVKGKKQHPIYKWLSDSSMNGWNNKAPSWNFFKYYIDSDGRLVEYFPSKIKPTDTLITRHIINIEQNNH